MENLTLVLLVIAGLAIIGLSVLAFNKRRKSNEVSNDTTGNPIGRKPVDEAKIPIEKPNQSGTL